MSMVDRNAGARRQRPSPYQAPNRSPPPPGNVEGKWGVSLPPHRQPGTSSKARTQHDLFEGGSSLYNPRVTPLAAPQAPALSPSFAPFGAAYTPNLPPKSPPARQKQHAEEPGSSDYRSLADRLNGSTSSSGPSLSLLARVGIEQKASRDRNGNGRGARNPPSQQQQQEQLQQQSLRASFPPPQHRLPEVRQEPISKMRSEQPVAPVIVGIKVRVTNLVEGTSAEDVQTAFSQFGTILATKIATTFTNSQGRNLLVAEVTFQNEKDAELAVETLNGALADGESLEVKIVKDVPPPAPRQPTPRLPQQQPPSAPRGAPTGPKAMLSRSQTQPRAAPAGPTQPANLFARLGVSGGPAPAPRRTASVPQMQAQNFQRQSAPVQQQEMQMSIPASAGSMRADELELLDPRAYKQVQPPQIHRLSQDEIEQQKRRAREQQRQQRAPVSLASRLGMGRVDMDLS